MGSEAGGYKIGILKYYYGIYILTPPPSPCK